jgi:hypothetical protein
MGSVVTDYKLYRNQGGDDQSWTEIKGFKHSNHGYVATFDVASESMTAGKFYQFVYSAKNEIGFSVLTKVVSIPVADIPLKA